VVLPPGTDNNIPQRSVDLTVFLLEAIRHGRAPWRSDTMQKIGLGDAQRFIRIWGRLSDYTPCDVGERPAARVDSSSFV
jgi:hypothetical protein